MARSSSGGCASSYHNGASGDNDSDNNYDGNCNKQQSTSGDSGYAITHNWPFFLHHRLLGDLTGHLGGYGHREAPAVHFVWYLFAATL